MPQIRATPVRTGSVSTTYQQCERRRFGNVIHTCAKELVPEYGFIVVQTRDRDQLKSAQRSQYAVPSIKRSVKHRNKGLAFKQFRTDSIW